MLYSVVASFPLFFAGGYAIRLQDDLGLSKARFGWAVSAYFISSAVGSFTVGGWIDRRGAWGWPGVMYYTVVRSATSSPATATAVVVAGVFLGSIAGPPLLAAVAERASYGSAWGVAAVLSMVATGLIGLSRLLTPAAGRLERSPARSVPDSSAPTRTGSDPPALSN